MMIDFLPENTHPLNKLWWRTDDWFITNEEDFLMQHDSAKICDYFQGKTSEEQAKATNYKKQLQKALGFAFPETWWQNGDSISNIHESLKCLCGHFFCGQNDSAGRRHISLGAAYLIALMAHQQAWSNVEPLTKNIKNWEKLTKSNSQLFSLQDLDNAKSSAMALYDLFLRLFEKRDEESQSQIRKVIFQEPGNMLRIQLKWKANQNARNRNSSLARQLSQSLEQQNIHIPNEASNTKSAILRLWKSMLVSEEGFMSPGIVYMERDVLVLASLK